MKCPVCHTQNLDNEKEHCTQCNSDLHVHRLLQQLQEKLISPTLPPVVPQYVLQKSSPWQLFFQIVPSILLLACALLGIFAGLRFLSTMDRMESHRTSLSNRWSETGFEQLEKMNTIIQQELNLILEQRQENVKLQEKIQTLTENQANVVTPP